MDSASLVDFSTWPPKAAIKRHEGADCIGQLPGPSFPLLGQWISGLGSGNLERMGICSMPVFFCLIALFDPYRSGGPFGSHTRRDSNSRTRNTVYFSVSRRHCNCSGSPTGIGVSGYKIDNGPTDHGKFPANGPYQSSVEAIVGLRDAELGYSRR